MVLMVCSGPHKSWGLPTSEDTAIAGSPGRDLHALPKAHLHLHFTGSMRPATVEAMATANGVRLPHLLRTGAPLMLDNSPRGWFRFQRLYDAARAVVRTPADLRRIVMEAAEDDAAEGSRWLELQVDPTSYGPLAGGITPALEVILAAATEATHTTGCAVAIVVAANRVRHPLDARTLARLAARYAGDGPGTVVGFGLSNDERQGSTAQFAAAFDIARNAGLRLMPHSGELLGPDHVSQTLTALKPDRLGHGVRSAEDPRVLAQIVADGVALEVCPTSNVALGVYPHLPQVPLRSLLAAGAQVALGADDPLLFGARLVDQYYVARTHHGLKDAELAQLAAASVRASCASSEVQRAICADIDLWLRPGQLSQE